MLAVRVMPCLLLQDGSLVKTVRFENPGYVGDPTNAIRIFNEKEVDELVVLDIKAGSTGTGPPFPIIAQFASECFMPVAYGGGLNSLPQMREVLRLGIEKVVVNTAAVHRPELVREAADAFGSQSVVVSIDARRTSAGTYEVMTRAGRESTATEPGRLAERMQQMGAGEIFLTSIDRDGTMQGYEIELIRQVTSAVDIPVIACGGAGKVSDFAAAVEEGGASAVAAGSMVVYFGRNRAVLINFPSRRELETVLGLRQSP